MFDMRLATKRDKAGAKPSAGMASRWAIVLAGGNGARMTQPIVRWLGEDRPKQYCAFLGSRTMLQRTLDRISGIVSPEQIIVVIRGDQRELFDEFVEPGTFGKVIEQPSDRGTMAAIYAATAHVLVKDSNASVLLCPSDHYVGSEKQYAEYMEHGLRLADRYGDQTFLLGINADHAETDYGWIVPGEKISLWDRQCPSPIPLTVQRFREKPSPQEAEQLFQMGGLWNSLSIAVKAINLWSLGWRVLPHVMGRFETFLKMVSAIEYGGLDHRHESMALERLYDSLDVIDFSKDILESAHSWCSVLPVDEVEWSDWGRPERIKESLVRLGKPSFAIPLEYLEPSEPGPMQPAAARVRVPVDWAPPPSFSMRGGGHPPCVQ
jgi:mannose-1-phosphate guanylyltransferase